MEMFIQAINIQQYVSENGRLPSDLHEVGDSPAAVHYVPLGGNTFKLSGKVGDITVDFTSTQPAEDLIADARQIVSGGVSSSSGGAPAI